MSKTVELTDLVIKEILINYEKQFVYVEYDMVDASGNTWGGRVRNSAIFWITMPENPRENDFLLPSSYVSTLVSLRNDADAVLSAKFLI